MSVIKQAIAIIEHDEVMQCDCPKCIEDRWAFELAIQALREKAEREQKPHTNADLIRCMSDEELAKIIVSESVSEKIPFCQNKPECSKMLDDDELIPESHCIKCALDWLQMDKLLPCPFCGGEGVTREWDGFGCYVRCTECKACGAVKPTEKEAIAAWNRRTRKEPQNDRIGGDS